MQPKEESNAFFSGRENRQGRPCARPWPSRFYSVFAAAIYSTPAACLESVKAGLRPEKALFRPRIKSAARATPGFPCQDEKSILSELETLRLLTYCFVFEP